MPTPILRQLRTGNTLEDARALDQQTDLRALLSAPFLRGRSLTFEVTGPTDLKVAHGLGRTPVGWLITDITGGEPTMYRDAWDTTHITFVCPVSCRVVLWVW